mgnify:CR=1 FL=1
MNNKVDFFYDFSSPYTFIAHKRIKEIKKNTNIDFLYKPMLLGGLHKLAGITANAFIGHKNDFMIQDCIMVSKKLGINFYFNDKFPINSLYLMRGTLVLEENLLEKYIDIFFESYWQLNLDLSDRKIFEKKLNEIGVDINKFFKDIENQSIKDKLKEITNEAFTKKIFGAPSFIHKDIVYWGQDRLDYLIDNISK